MSLKGSGIVVPLPARQQSFGWLLQNEQFCTEWASTAPAGSAV